jgi:hypothetical protein
MVVASVMAMTVAPVAVATVAGVTVMPVVVVGAYLHAVCPVRGID